MTRFLLQLLCDPVTKEPLRLVDETLDSTGDIVEGTLKSPSGRSYPIRGGIPRFVFDGEFRGTVASFGDEWNHFNFTDFKSHWLAHTVHNTFGSTEAFESKVIVDAGGGSGAQTLWMLEAGARHVIMLELSDSVDDVVQRNLRSSRFRNYDVIQCSIDAPPLKARSIEGIVYCHNVIQHTRSVHQTARMLFDLVAPGGEFVFNCYSLNDETLLRWVRFHLLYMPLRRILSRNSFNTVLAYSRAMGTLRQLPMLGALLEKAGLCVQGDVLRSAEDTPAAYRRQRIRATVLNTFDYFGAHRYQHHISDDGLRALVATLQPDSSRVGNMLAYFRRPPPIGCALRVFR